MSKKVKDLALQYLAKHGDNMPEWYENSYNRLAEAKLCDRFREDYPTISSVEGNFLYTWNMTYESSGGESIGYLRIFAFDNGIVFPIPIAMGTTPEQDDGSPPQMLMKLYGDGFRFVPEGELALYICMALEIEL